MQPKHPLLQKCLAYLESLPHLNLEIQVEATPYVEETVVADSQIVVTTSQGSVTYIVVIKSNVTNETLPFDLDYLSALSHKLERLNTLKYSDLTDHYNVARDVVRDAAPRSWEQRIQDSNFHGVIKHTLSNYRLLLIAQKVSQLVAQQLIQKNIEFIDTQGNCYLNSPALYLLTTSNPLTTKASTESLEVTPSTVQLMYALLQTNDSRIHNAVASLIAKTEHISQKTIKNQLDRLYQLSYLHRQPNGGYRIANPTKLFERWELGYIETLRPKLMIETYTPSSGRRFSDVKDDIIHYAEQEGYLIGGELGGAIATKYLNPIGATLHLPPTQNPTSLFLKLKLKPDKQGSITFMRQFGSHNAWHNSPAPMLADPLLIHAEMMTLATDDRIRETSDRLYNQYLAERQEVVEAI
jgi:hypothetical protein